MPDILRSLPLTSSSKRLALPNEASAVVRADQIIAWVGFSSPDSDAPPPSSHRFPAVVDTGCGFPFVLHQTHLTNWVGAEWNAFPKLPDGRVYRRRAQRFDADLWIYPNRPGDYAEILPEATPFRLTIDDSFGVTVSDVTELDRFGTHVGSLAGSTTLAFPRLPLIGLPALKLNDLILTVDAGRGRVRLRKPRRWGFLRW